MSSTIGWTIKDWQSKQAELSPNDGFNLLLSLLRSIKPEVAWITIASEDILKTQWNELQNLPNPSVS